MTDIETFPDTWCRMWSEDATLAHDLLTEEGRQWASRTPGLDTAIGPEAAEAFITTYQRDVGNLFRARTLVLGADLVAYTWDLTKRDGTVISGADANVLHDGKVVDNWTFVADGRDERDDLSGAGAASAAELASLVRAEASRRGVSVHRDPIVDVTRQTAAYLWVPGVGEPGGLDVLVVRDAVVARTSSVPARRPFVY